MAKKLINKYSLTIAFIILLLGAVLILFSLWYAMPPELRLLYYKKQNNNIYAPFIEDSEFDINIKGISQTYDFNNKRAVPFNVEWHITDDHGVDIPSGPYNGTGGSYRRTYYNVKILSEFLVGSRVIYSIEGEGNISLSYSHNLRTGKKSRYFILSKCDYPARASFSQDCKLRITVIETDSRLEGLKGVLVVKTNALF